jgi:hypothetical protein
VENCVQIVVSLSHTVQLLNQKALFFYFFSVVAGMHICMGVARRKNKSMARGAR